MARARTFAAERGGVAITMIVLMVVVLASGALVVRSLDGLRDTRRDGERAGATAAVEVALAEALARIDLGQATSFTGSDVVSAGTPDEMPILWDAVRNADGSWSVYAEAGVDDARRAAQARVAREIAPPRTLFAVDELRLDRNAGVIEGTVGTNGRLKAIASDLGDQQDLAGPAATCVGCDNPIVLATPVEIDDIVVPAAPIRSCPTDAEFRGTIDGAGGVPIVCLDPSTPVTFIGIVEVVNGPLHVHVGPDVDVVLDGAQINVDLDASQLRLVIDDNGTGATFSAETTLMKGVIEAPGRTLETEGFALRGSLLIGTYRQPGGGLLTMDDDAAIADTGDVSFRLVGWEPVTPR